MKSDTKWIRTYIWAFLIIVGILSTGCAPKIKGQSQESYRSSWFSDTALNNEGLALMPVIILKDTFEKAEETSGKTSPAPYTPSNVTEDTGKEKLASDHDAYRVMLGETLLSNIQSRRPMLRLVSPGNTLIRLNDEGLTDAYIKFNRNFTKVGLDAVQLKRFGRALNCRYLFISMAVVTEYKSYASLTFVWTFGNKSILRSVKISGQIWDTQSGIQIWEGSGVGYNRLFPYSGLPLIEEIANQAVNSLLETVMP